MGDGDASGDALVVLKWIQVAFRTLDEASPLNFLLRTFAADALEASKN